MPATGEKSDFITTMRAVAEAYIAADQLAFAALNKYNDVWVGTMVDGDFTGSNAGIPAADFLTAVTQITNLHNFFSAGGTLPSGVRGVLTKIA